LFEEADSGNGSEVSQGKGGWVEWRSVLSPFPILFGSFVGGSALIAVDPESWVKDLFRVGSSLGVVWVAQAEKKPAPLPVLWRLL
jgi:hypothetical protein